MAARREFRLRLRKGEALGFYIHTCIGFLDLSRELRDQIYILALISPKPIVACSLSMDHFGNGPFYMGDNGKTIYEENFVLAPRDSVLDTLVLSLFRTSVVIGREAAAVFYRLNTFHFGGTQVWNPLYSFLDMIGNTNRSYLQKLSLELDKPSILKRDNHGTRTLGRSWHYPYQKVISCGHREEQYDTFFIDPAIEACFRILGSKGPPLDLELLLAPPFLPGVNIGSESADEDEYYFRPWYSLDIPEHIERCRAVFASRVDIWWFGMGIKDTFLMQTENFQAKGWNVLETKDRYHDSQSFPHFRTYFVAQRIVSNRFARSRSRAIEQTIEHYHSIEWPLKPLVA